MEVLKNFNDWKDLGLKFGLLNAKLRGIQKDYSDNHDCKREMLAAWLQWNYDYTTYGKPSWAKLHNALKGLDDVLASNMEIEAPWLKP